MKAPRTMRRCSRGDRVGNAAATLLTSDPSMLSVDGVGQQPDGRARRADERTWHHSDEPDQHPNRQVFDAMFHDWCGVRGAGCGVRGAGCGALAGDVPECDVLVCEGLSRSKNQCRNWCDGSIATERGIACTGESLEVQTFEPDGILLGRQRERGTDGSRSFDNAIDVFLGKRMVIGERHGLGDGAARRREIVKKTLSGLAIPANPSTRSLDA